MFLLVLECYQVSLFTEKEKHMKQCNSKKSFHLKLWEEIVGKLHGVSNQNHYLYIEIGERVLSFQDNTEEETHVHNQDIRRLIGKTIAILQTDIPDKPILIRQICKRVENEESNF